MTGTSRRDVIRALLAGGAGLAGLGPAVAREGFPSKPIRWIVPWPAGTPGDIAARFLGEHMGTALGQPIVVENKPGASGTIGYGEVLRQPADGHTLLMLGGPGHLVAPLMFPARNLDYLKTLEPVGNTHWNYNALVVAPESPLEDAQAIVAAAKAEPGSLTFASGGIGTPAHLAADLLNQRTGVRTSHVPYSQFAIGIADVSTGRISYMFLTTAAAIGQIRSGKLRPLAVTSPQRLAALPNVPTMIEAGFPGFVVRAFEGVAVKAGTPRAIVERLNLELNKALALPDIKERFVANGWDIEPTTPEQFGEAFAAESGKWLRIGREAGVQPV